MRFLLPALILASSAMADPVTIADLSRPDAPRWRFFTDGVMGGVSTGQATIADGALTMQGDVSTANNGGFIQARLEDVRLPPDATRITARVRGDGQTYFLHLRTTGTMLPWQYYQAAFTAPTAWGEITLHLSDFKPSGRMLRGAPRAGDVRSVALVAYGRDHAADVALQWLRAD